MPLHKFARGLLLSLAAGALLSAGSSPRFYDLLHTLAAKPGQIAEEWRTKAIAEAEAWAKDGADVVMNMLLLESDRAESRKTGG